jgi:RNA polymerase primary sigma factor
MLELDQAYLDKIKQFPELEDEEVCILARKSTQGNIESRNRLVHANLRLVIHIALRYRNLGIPLQDLVAAGNIGLIHAAERFHPDQGARFSTYAGIWIKQKIIRLLHKLGRQVKVPETRFNHLQKIKKASTHLKGQLGREPTELEIRQSSGLSQKNYQAALKAEISTSSLDRPLSDEDAESHTLQELISREKEPAPDHQLLRDEKFSELLAGLDALSDAELKIILRRFGLDGDPPENLSSIGEDFNLSRESIRQMESRAISKAKEEIDQIDDSEQLQQQKKSAARRIRSLSDVKTSSFRRSDKGKRGPKRKNEDNP